LKDGLLQRLVVGRQRPWAGNEQTVVSGFKLIDNQAHNLSYSASHPVAPGGFADMAADGECESAVGRPIIGTLIDEQDDQRMRPASPVLPHTTNIGRAPQTRARRQHTRSLCSLAML